MVLNRYGIKEPVNPLLNRNGKQNKRENHDMLVFVSEVIKLIPRQGLVLKGR